MTKQVHAAIGMLVIDHRAAAAKLSQCATRILFAADNHTAMAATRTVRPFVARTTNQLHLIAQLSHQRVAAGLCQQQLRRTKQRAQLKPLCISACVSQQLHDACQPLLIGGLHRLRRYIHREGCVTTRHRTLLVQLMKGMLRAVDGAHAIVAQERAIAFNQKATTALNPLRAPSPVHRRQVKPR